MTELNDDVDINHSVREIPKIQGDEDEPFFTENQSEDVDQPDKNLPETDDIGKEITRFRFRTGRSVLYISMSAMGLSVAVDLLSKKLNLESDLINSAFEAFKLITMTVLGYFFASNNSKFN